MRVLFLLAALWLATMFWAVDSIVACEVQGAAVGVLAQWGPVQGCTP